MVYFNSCTWNRDWRQLTVLFNMMTHATFWGYGWSEHTLNTTNCLDFRK